MKAQKLRTTRAGAFGDDEGDVVVLFAVGELANVRDDLVQ